MDSGGDYSARRVMIRWSNTHIILVCVSVFLMPARQEMCWTACLHTSRHFLCCVPSIVNHYVVFF